MSGPKELLQTLTRGAADLSQSCQAAVRLQSEALDHKLPWRQRWGLRLHLLLCKWCRRYGRQISFLRGAARQHPEMLLGAAPRKLSDEARERIRKQLRSGRE